MLRIVTRRLGARSSHKEKTIRLLFHRPNGDSFLFLSASAVVIYISHCHSHIINI
jgi:hypothetical protein